MTIYTQIHALLVDLGIIHKGAIREGRSQSSSYMDLVVEALPMHDINGGRSLAFSMAHYFEQNGDLCSDPEMVVLYHPETSTAEAYSFQQSLPPVYDVVYPEPGQVNTAAKRNLNGFLSAWLKNLQAQGHRLQ
jgi:hypothetical protein